MHRRISLIIACLAISFEALATDLEVLQSGEPAKYTVPLPPGQLFTFNFVVGPSGSSVAATFKSGGPAVVASAIVHPRSDLVQRGEELLVECPGIGNHAIQISSTTEPIATGSIHANPSEAGHFGFAFRNTGDRPATLRVSIVSKSRIMIGFVGLRRGDVVPLSPKRSAPAETSVGSRPTSRCSGPARASFHLNRVTLQTSTACQPRWQSVAGR